MDSVEAHVPRAADAHERVQVGSVVVQLGSGRVNKFRYIQYLTLKQPQGIGVCEHERGDVLGQLALQVRQADPSVRTGLDLDHAEAVERGAGGVGTVGRVRHQNLSS